MPIEANFDIDQGLCDRLATLPQGVETVWMRGDEMRLQAPPLAKRTL